MAVVLSSEDTSAQTKKAAYSIENDKVLQGNFMAHAMNDQQIRSNYESNANLFQPNEISFKFAINGKDNEMVSGQDHHFVVNSQNGIAETPLIIFGKQLLQKADKMAYIQPNTKLKIRLDAREIVKQMDNQGFFTCFNGTKIYKQDFKGIYIAGGTLPMIWDFDNLIHKESLLLKDVDGDGIYETELILNAKQDQKISLVNGH